MSETDGAAQLKRLKCAEGPRLTATTAHQEGKEAATVRYEDEKEISEGDRLALETEEEEPFATAEVTAVKETFAWRAYPAIRERDAVYGSGSTAHLIASLNHHYEDTIWPSTRVKVILYEVASFAE